MWNACGGDLATVLIPATLGVLAAAGQFFLTPWSLALRGLRRWIAFAVCVLLFGFVVLNSMRLASIVSADAAQARADRQTVGTVNAQAQLEKALTAQSRDCGPGGGKSKACALAQDAARMARDDARKAADSVAKGARPEGADFARLIVWASAGALRPSADDFAMLWLAFRTLLPQLGGVVLMLARR